MFKDREKLYQAYHAMLSIALTWALVLVMNQYFDLKVPIFINAIYALIPGVLIYLFDINKKNYISYLLVFSLIPLLALVFWVTKTNPIRWVRDIIDWCMVYNGGDELYHTGYANLVLFASSLASAIIFYLLTRNQIARSILAAILMVTMVVLSISKININKAVVGISLFFIMTILVELYGIIYSKKAGRQEKKEGILYLAPVCLIIALFATVLPSKPEPIEWKAFKTAYQNVKEQLEIWNTNLNYYLGNSKSEFFVNLTGYSDQSGELQKDGKLIKDNKIAMKLSGLDKGKTVYLSGSVSDIYTGSSWDKSREDYLAEEEEYQLDYAELFFALTRMETEVLENNNFLKRRTVKVVYNNIKTKTFFYPLKTSWFDMFTDYRKFTKETPQINFKKARGKGTSYQVVYYEMNLESEEFQQILREADDFSYQTYDNREIDQNKVEYIKYYTLYHDNMNVLLERQDYYDVLSKRADMIKERYTNLPEQLPSRIYDLAAEITEGYDNDYDKLKAIEEYLLTNYTYSFEVDQVPEGEDFVDYFLFESKKGYCTYYATSMAVLGRCIGVPTRYVEGFLGKFNVRDEEYMYLVKNSQAHAWAEAYIEGIGWIPFEATTPFFSDRYTTWPKPQKQSTDNNTGGSNAYENQPPLMPYQNDSNIEEVVTIEGNKSEEIISGVIMFLSAILILFLILVIYYNILKYQYKKIFEKADNNKKIDLMFRRILQKLKREGFYLAQQETILMLSERVKDRFHYNKITFIEIADIYMRYRYGDEVMTKEELDAYEVYYKGLAEKERSEINRIKIWTEEFMFLAKKSNY